MALKRFVTHNFRSRDIARATLFLSLIFNEFHVLMLENLLVFIPSYTFGMFEAGGPLKS